MDLVKIGSRMRAARKDKDMTLREIADTLGVAVSTIQRYESGAFDNVKLPMIEAIAKCLDVNPAWLVYKSDERRAPGTNIMGWDSSADGKPAEATLTDKDKKDIAKTLDGIMQDLENVDGLMFDGDPMSDEAIESLRSAMLMGLELVKLKNKKKYGRKTKKEPNK